MAVGFLHDLDKIEGVQAANLTADHVGHYAEAYGIYDFLSVYDYRLSNSEMLALIHTVDSKAASSDAAFVNVNAHHLGLARRYVRAADRLDGASLRMDVLSGANHVLVEWQKLTGPGSLLGDGLCEWVQLVMDMPLLPTLLEHMHTSLETACADVSGLYPLYSAVNGGTLMMLVPAAQADTIMEVGLDAALGHEHLFGSGLYIGPQGIPFRINGQTPESWNGFRAIIDRKRGTSDGRRMSEVKVSDLTKAHDQLRGLVVSVGLDFSVPRKAEKNASVIGSLGEDHPNREREEFFLSASAIISIEAMMAEATQAPTLNERVDAIFELVGGRPSWTTGFDRMSLRTVAACLATASAFSDADKLVELNNLFSSWYAACTGGRVDRSEGIRESARRRLATIMRGELDYVSDAIGTATCAITGEPGPTEDAIQQSDGLYGLKSSAFSFRRGRSESRVSDKGHTVIGPLAFLELKLKAGAYPGGRPGGLPLTVVSPSVTGLFGGVFLKDGDDRACSLSSWDLVKTNVETLTFNGDESWRRRVFVCRYEEYPAKLSDRIGFVRRMLEATRRFGRPIHIFRGIPNAKREFFWFDAADPEIRWLLGGPDICGLRLEQIADAIERFRTAEVIIAQSGLGMTVASAYASAKPFGATAVAWWAISNADDKIVASRSKHLNEQLLKLENDAMENEESGLVRLGRLAGTVQQRVTFHSTKSEIEKLFRISSEAGTAMWEMNARDRESIVCAVADNIKNALSRGRKGFSSKAYRTDGRPLQDAIRTFAEVFHDEVWVSVFKRRPPAGTLFRNAVAAYAWSFSSLPKISVSTDDGVDLDSADIEESQAA